MQRNLLVDLRIDFAFKQLFGSAGSERILIDFLNELLKLPLKKRIRQVTVINSEVLKEYEVDKKSILDLLVITNDNMFINIEIQFGREYDMPVRTLYYGARIFTAQMVRSMTYAELKQTITINIVNFTQFETTDAYHSRFELYDPDVQLGLTDLLQVHFIELPKLLKKWENGEVNPREDRLVRWLLMFEATENELILDELEGIAMQLDPVLKEAFEKWEELSRDPKTVLAYEMRHKQLKDEYAREHDAGVRIAKLEKAAAENLAEAIEEAELKGRAEGEAKGKAEMIRVMLQKGVSAVQIVEMTGLTSEAVDRIVSDLFKADSPQDRYGQNNAAQDLAN